MAEGMAEAGAAAGSRAGTHTLALLNSGLMGNVYLRNFVMRNCNKNELAEEMRGGRTARNRACHR